MGGISTIIDILLLYVGFNIFGINLYISAVFSFCIASVNGYLLNQNITFDKNTGGFVNYIKFLGVSIVGLILTIVLLYFFTTILSIHYLLSKIITVLIVVFWNYFANSVWTFK